MQTLAVLVGLPLLALAVAVPLLLARLLGLGEKASLLLLLAVLLSLLGLAVGVPLAVALRRVLRFHAALDAMFEPLGLGGRRYVLLGRQYHGAVEGRQVDAYFQPGHAGRPGEVLPSPARLSLYLAARAAGSLGMGAGLPIPAGPGGLLAGRPGWEGRVLNARDLAWAEALLSDPAAEAALLRLGETGSGAEIRNLLVRPGFLHLQMAGPAPTTLTPEAARSLVEDLAAVAAAAERLPPPAQAEPVSSLEEAMRSDRDRVVSPLLLAMLALVVPLVAGAALLVVLLVVAILTGTSR